MILSPARTSRQNPLGGDSLTAGTHSCVSPAPAAPAAPLLRLPGALLVLSKPGIVLAEAVAGFTGLLLASRGLPQVTADFCWSLASLLLAASGAAMGNSYLEAETDRQMPRLATRSTALAIVGRRSVLIIALSLMLFALGLTRLFLNNLSLLLLATACSSYLLLYTRWLKRCSPWGVLAGAIPGALPPLVCGAAVSGSISGLPLLLAMVIYLWQLPHFWFLALRYSEQYRQAGIPVLPVTHGAKLTKILILLSATALLPTTLTFGLLYPFSHAFILVILLAGIIFPLICYRYLYLTAEYRKGYRVSLAYLAVIFVALITDVMLAMKH